MNKIIMIGTGGFIGSVLRYFLSGFVQNMTGSIAFPYGTLSVNIVGSFFMGMLSQLIESQLTISIEMKLMLIVGMLGSFTTFSTFTDESVNLLNEHRYMLLLINVGSQLILGLIAIILGRYFVNSIWR